MTPHASSYRPEQVRPADLYEVFDRVVGQFAFTPCSYLGRPNAVPAAGLDLEFHVALRGPVNALVALRTTQGAARLMAQGVDPGREPSPADCLDALREASNLFAGHLLTERLDGRLLPYEPFLPAPGRPDAWPKRAPDAACALLLETEPIELRYWQEARS